MKCSWKNAGSTFTMLLWGGVLLGQQADIEARSNVPPANDAAAGAEADLPPAPPGKERGPDIDAGAKTDGAIDADAERDPVDANASGRSRAGARGNTRGDAANRAALGVRFEADGQDDLTIGRVVPGSPAARIGLRAGDRIVSVNGQTYDGTDAFVDAAGRFSLDEDAEIVFLRNGVEQTASVRFAPWGTIYGDGAARTHTTLRPSFESGAPAPADVQSQGSVNRGYVAPQFDRYGAYPQYPRFYRYRSWDADEFDDDDCFDD